MSRRAQRDGREPHEARAAIQHGREVILAVAGKKVAVGRGPATDPKAGIISRPELLTSDRRERMVSTEEMSKLNDIYGGKDPQELPLYRTTDVARMLLVPRSTVRTWAFRVRGKDGLYRAPVIEAADRKNGLLSFENLVELHVLSSLRRGHQIPLPTIRKAVRYLKTELGTKHPLSSEQMYTDGVDLFVERLGQLIGASQEGQHALTEVLRPYLDRVERDHERLLRLYPVTNVHGKVPDLDSPRTIGIDPRMRFGKPYVVECGIETEVFADRWHAGETIEDMVKDFQITREAVEEALRYETLPRAA